MGASGNGNHPISGDYFSSPRARFIFIGTFFIGAVLIVILIFSSVLYTSRQKREAKNLAVLVNTQATLLEHIVASSTVGETQPENDAVLRKVMDLAGAFEGKAAFGETGQFVVGRELDGNILIVVNGESGEAEERSIPADSDFAEPMRRALRGESGTITGLDYNGVPVMAAYRPLSSHNLGLVAKIEKSEVRWIGITAIAYGAAASILVALVAAFILERDFRHVMRAIQGLVEKLQHSQALAKLGHFEFDPTEEAVAWSPEARNVLGLSDEDAVTPLDFYFQLIPEKDRTRIQKEIYRNDLAGIGFDLVHDIITAHGANRTIRLSCRGSLPEADPTLPIIGTVQDITLQENLRRGLAEERERLRTTFDSIGDAVIVVSSDCSVEMMNAEAERLTGRSLGEMVGQPFPSKVQLIDLETREHLEGKLVESTLAGTPISPRNHLELVRKDGGTIPVTETTSPIRNRSGQQNGAVIVLRDHSTIYRRRRIAEFRLALHGKAPSMARDELVQFALDEISDLLGSPISFYHFVSKNGTDFSNQHWSTKSLDMYAAENETELKCSLDGTDLCAEVVTTKEPVLHNDHSVLTDGTTPANQSLVSSRELVAPVFDSGRVVAVLGVSGKGEDYTEEETELILELADATWRTIKEKRSEEALRNSQHRLQLLVENLSSGVIVHNLDSAITLANPAATEILGIPLEDMLASKYTDSLWEIHREDGSPLPRSEYPFVQTLEAGGPVHGMLVSWIHKATGERRWLECSGCPLLDADGNTNEILISFSDLTSTRQEFEARQASERQFRATFENAPIGIAHVSLDGQLLRVNPAFEELVAGLSKSPNPHIQEIFDTTNIANGLIYSEPILSGQTNVYTEEFQVTKSRGLSLWLNCIASLVRNEQGNPEYFVVTLKDTTERKEAEANADLLTSCLEATIDAVIVTKPDGTVQWVNPAFERLSGYSFDEVIGKNPNVLKSGKQDRSYYEDLWETISSGKAWRGEFVNRSKSGKEYIVEVSITPVLSSGGVVTHYVGVQTDVTRQRTTEQQLRQAQKLEAIGTLAAGIAHDFNNILSSIIGYSDLALQDLEAGSRTYKDIEKVKGAGDRAKELVRQILAFSRTNESNCVVMNPSPILKEATNLLEKTLPESIDFQVSLGSMDARIEIDPTELHQIVMNLVTNAYHALPNEKGRISVEMRSTHNNKTLVGASSSLLPGDYVMLKVVDDGTGIDPNVIGSIFDPFFTTKEVDKGTGLGLSTVHGIVTANGGTIFVESTLGQGSTFTIYFPVVEERGQVVSKQVSTKVSGHGKCVLVVDDQIEVCSLHTRILETLGFDVLSVTESSAAVEMVRESLHDFAFVLTDYTMPVMDGYEMAQKMWEMNPKLPVIVCSGRNDVLSKLDDSNQSTNLHYLTKPIEVSKLTELLNHVLRT